MNEKTPITMMQRAATITDALTFGCKYLLSRKISDSMMTETTGIMNKRTGHILRLRIIALGERGTPRIVIVKREPSGIVAIRTARTHRPIHLPFIPLPRQDLKKPELQQPNRKATSTLWATASSSSARV
jgi:hypothetical protein